MEEYTRMMLKAAIDLWGEEQAAEMKAHVERVSRAVWKVGNTQLDLGVEPVTRLKHRRDE